jgi:hydroxypyruvate reductase
MQPHARFINIARGDVVDEDALIEALQTGQIGGAGLDVYEHEPKVPEALTKMENVALLPHLGTAALEVRERMGFVAVDNLVAALNGETPPNLVN